MMKKLYTAITQHQVNLQQWLIGFAGILFVRFLLENLSSTTALGVIGSDISTILHYYLFYGTLAIALILILHIFLQTTIEQNAKLVLFGLLITWLPPIVDFLFSWGNGFTMTYYFAPASDLLFRYLTFFGPIDTVGITPGIRLELALVVIAIFALIRHVRGSASTALFGAWVTYSVLFIWLSLPSLIAIGAPDIIGFFQESIYGSFLVQNAFHPGWVMLQPERQLEVFFNLTISHVYALMLMVLLSMLAWKWDAHKFLAIIKNSRPERVLHYWLMITLGIGLAVQGPGIHQLISWTDVTSLMLLFAAFYFAWMFAVGVNDIVDQIADQKNGHKRPLITGALTIAEMRAVNVIMLIVSITFGFLVGHYALFMILAFTALYYVYSSPPLQLKRFLGMNSFIISLCALSAVLAGFFTVSATAQLDAFSPLWIAAIVLIFTVVANVKDVKDIAGDHAAGIQTLPVVYGEMRGRQIIGIGIACSMLFLAWMIGGIGFWIASLFFGGIAYMVIMREPFVERHVFYVYYIYVGVLILLSCFT